MKGMDSLERELRDFDNPLRIIYPALQKIGRPVINPVIPRAAAVRFSPVFDRMYFAMLSVPPVLSRIIPMMAPSIISRPIEAIVLPKPCWIILTIFPGGSSMTARSTETTNKEKNASTLSLDVRKIMRRMLDATMTEVQNILIQPGYIR